MDRERWEKIKDLFEHALELAPPGRAEYLEAACGTDSALRAEIEALLDHDRRAGRFLESSHARDAEVSGQADLSSLTFSPGNILSGRFQITRFIGRGGMGEVYEARDLDLGSHLALKTLRPQIAGNAWALDRFKQEIQLARRVTHANVCRIFDIERHRMEDGTSGDGSDLVFITMELLRGEALSEVLRRSGRMDAAKALPLIQQMAAALEAAHDAGVIHRDFKPGNVMLVRAKAEETGERAVVTDFGLARAAVDASVSNESFAESLSRTHQLLGTLAYMAPEQLEGRAVTPATDIYALGLVAYEMLTGRTPYPPDAPLAGAFLRVKEPPASPRKYNPELDRTWEHGVLRCLEIEPSARFPSAREAAAAFGGGGKLSRSRMRWSAGARKSNGLRSRALRFARAASALGAMVVLVGVGLYQASRSAPQARVLEINQVTNDGFPKPHGMGAIDGSTLYFSELRDGRHLTVAEVSTSGGAVIPLHTSLPNPWVQDFSPDRSELLVIDIPGPDSVSFADGQVWALKMPEGTSRRVGGISAATAAWSPDGKTIGFGGAGRILICDPEGANVRELTHFAGTVANLAWSPDGTKLRFQVALDTPNVGVWEVDLKGRTRRFALDDADSQIQPLAGKWTLDGRYFLFQAPFNGRGGLWGVREKKGWLHSRQGKPFILSLSIASKGQPVFGASGEEAYVAADQPRAEVVRFDARQAQFVPYIVGLSADQLDLSPDGQWLAYASYPGYTLWRSRPDGSDALQLAPPSLQATAPRWSPDGRQIVFMGKSGEQGLWRLYLVASSGGPPTFLVNMETEQGVATWFPDGHNLIFGDLLRTPTAHSLIHRIDLTTRQVSTVPGSEGLWTARLSPDGRYISALSGDNRDLMLFHVAQKRWSRLARTEPIGDIVWSRHGDAIYFDDLHHRTGIFCLHLKTRQIEKVASLGELNSSWWLGLAPDDSPLLMRDVGSQEIYALHCRLP